MGTGGSGDKGVEMRGQIYSMVMIMITIPLMIYISFYIISLQEVRQGNVEKIIADQIHQVEDSIDRDFQKAMEVSVKRALLAATADVIKNGEVFSDGKSVIMELVINGTLRGNTTFTMYNNTLDEWKGRITSINPGFNINLEFHNTDINSHDGMSLDISVDLITNISDRTDAARINKEIFRLVLVSVEGIEDPTYPINTLGYVGRKIEEFPYPYHALRIGTGSNVKGGCSGNVTFNPSDPEASQRILVTSDASGVSGFLGIVAESGNQPDPSVACWLLGVPDAVNVTNNTVSWSGYNEIYIGNVSSAAWSLPIKEALDCGYYSKFEADTGPDIFGRLEGDLTQASDGMESFVIIPEIENAGISIKQNQVTIDYLYFSSQSHTGSPVRGLYDWFRIDAVNAARYNLTELMQ
jgi:hypothetical protein